MRGGSGHLYYAFELHPFQSFLFKKFLVGDVAHSLDHKFHLAVIVKHRQSPLPQLPTSYREFQPLIQRMLAKEPASRFQSDEELLGWQPPA